MTRSPGVNLMAAAGTLRRMAKPNDKKPAGGKHKKPRRPVQFPSNWYAVAQRLAKKRPMPTVWYLVELVKKDAEANGEKDLPPPPWDEANGDKPTK